MPPPPPHPDNDTAKDDTPAHPFQPSPNIENMTYSPFLRADHHITRLPQLCSMLYKLTSQPAAFILPFLAETRFFFSSSLTAPSIDE